jgi:methyl-accepting chemotaxis protein
MHTTIATAMVSGDPKTSGERLTHEIAGKLGGAAPQLVAVFASTEQPLDQLTRQMSRRFPSSTLIGASTAGEFTERGDAKRSAVAFALAGDYRVYAGMGVGLKANPEQAMEQAIEGLPQRLHGYPHRTAVLLLDPLAGNGEETVLIAASMLGEDVRLAGGAAGDDLHMSTTQVACGACVATDAATVAVIFSRSPLGVGVCHGHRPLSRPLKVTRAQGNLVHAIDGRPAWEVWLEHTRESASSKGLYAAELTKDEEGGYLLRYEAGLAAGDDYKIRAPLSRNRDGSIAFACGIAEGSVIRITESEPERQVESAREAARRARSHLGGRAVAGALVFDCICRNLILGQGFARAVRGMSEELGDVPIAGFETYGEIALDVGDMSGFHNTTSVVLSFPES